LETATSHTPVHSIFFFCATITIRDTLGVDGHFGNPTIGSRSQCCRLCDIRHHGCARGFESGQLMRIQVDAYLRQRRRTRLPMRLTFRPLESERNSPSADERIQRGPHLRPRSLFTWSRERVSPSGQPVEDDAAPSAVVLALCPLATVVRSKSVLQARRTPGDRSKCRMRQRTVPILQQLGSYHGGSWRPHNEHR